MGPAIKWVIGNLRLALELLLVAALLVAGWMYRRQERKLEAAAASYAQLADNLQQQITIKNGEIEVLKRKGEKVIVKKVYVPVESPIIIHIPKPTTGNPTPEPVITLKRKGFCLRPGFGMEYGGKGLQGHLDAKWGYWDRYSGIAGGSRYNLGVGVTRHLDDVLWFRPQNIEFFLLYSPIRSEVVSPVSIGVRSNF